MLVTTFFHYYYPTALAVLRVLIMMLASLEIVFDFASHFFLLPMFIVDLLFSYEPGKDAVRTDTITHTQNKLHILYHGNLRTYLHSY